MALRAVFGRAIARSAKIPYCSVVLRASSIFLRGKTLTYLRSLHHTEAAYRYSVSRGRYQSIVRRMPSSSDTEGAHPVACRNAVSSA